jgi:hypothetical protein
MIFQLSEPLFNIAQIAEKIERVHGRFPEPAPRPG